MHFIILYPVMFAAIWAGVVFLISHASGWARLAEAYQGRAPDDLQWRWFASARMGYAGVPRLLRVSYKSTLCIGADAQNIYLKVLLPFRLGAPLLVIPLFDITITPTTSFGFAMAEYTFHGAPEIVVTISERLSRKLEADSKHTS